MNEQVQANMDMVNEMMMKAAAANAATVQQGNKALLAVPIDYVAESGMHYKGTVAFRRPSAMDYIRMGAIKSELLRVFGAQPIVQYVQRPDGGMQMVESMAHVDTTTKFLANALSICDVLLAQPVPEWLQDHRNLTDTDLILQVYNGFEDALASFRTGTQAVPSGNGEAGASPAVVANPEALR
jgi:hypothetical protein